MTVPPSELELDVISVGPEAEFEPEAAAKDIAGRSPSQLALSRLRHDKVSMAAFVVVVISVLTALAAPILESFGVLDPTGTNPKLLGGVGSLPVGSFGGASLSHPFGLVPASGTDVLSRVVLGVAFSLLIATAATIISAVIGTILGIIAGYTGKATDFWVSRSMDLVLAFPQLLMLLALSPVLKTRITSLGAPAGAPTDAVYLILVLGFFGWPYLGRIVRGQVLTLRNREFVEASRSLGATRRRIWFRELLPNLWAPLIIYVSLTLPLNISAESALSFLGAGLQYPTPSLGNILDDSTHYYQADPSYFFIPGAVLVLIVLAFNLLGDGLRDALDPKSNR